MDWNNNTPMELLSQAPDFFTESNRETIQAIIDNDKIICSTMLGYDVCGTYAPFCAVCEKSLKTPCAVAYIRWRQAEEILLEAACSCDGPQAEERVENVMAEEPHVEESTYECIEVTADEPVAEEYTETEEVCVENTLEDAEEIVEEESAQEEEIPVVDEQSVEVKIDEEPQAEQSSKRIRIAVAKRKLK